MDVAATMGRLEIRPFAGRIGAEIRGVDLRRPLDPEVVEELREVLARWGVVVFARQRLEPDGHLELAHQLGEIRMPPGYLPTLADAGLPQISVIGTAGERTIKADTWHADVTWTPAPPRYSILHMRVLPEAGGDTMWASQIDAYDRLSEPMKRFLEPLTAEHGLGSGGAHAVHPVVHRHPITGREALFVNPTFTQRIVELAEAESQAVLRMLYESITVPEAVCRWRWSVGDLAIWDNHFVLHYAITDYGQAPRTIHRIEVEGRPLIPASGE